MTATSALYVGTVMHRRLRPRLHRFRYRAFWLLIDLDDLETLPRLRLLSHNRANLFSLYDSDHGDGSPTPLRLQIEAQLAAAGIDLAGGAVRLFCMPRTFGYCFNPLSLYFCYRPDASLAAIVYQVHNTFGERHSYVMPVEATSGAVRQACGKTFYVSPFMDMDLHYEFRVAAPDDRIGVMIRVSTPEGTILHAGLQGRRRELTVGALLAVLVAIPAVSLKVIAAIHWEAARLWLKGVRLRPRPLAHGATKPVVG
jgi:DUF1365 family protein